MKLKILASALILLTISGCSLTPEVQIVTKPIQLEITQPILPRPISLKEPKWYVVSDSKIIEACLKNTETNKPDCKLGRETLYPKGYTYFDKFVNDTKKKNGGDLVFIAMSVEDYELMSYNIQELKRYIKQLGEIIVYYRNITIEAEKVSVPVE